jgi:hypothetical protein
LLMCTGVVGVVGHTFACSMPECFLCVTFFVVGFLCFTFFVVGLFLRLWNVPVLLIPIEIMCTWVRVLLCYMSSYLSGSYMLYIFCLVSNVLLVMAYLHSII